MEAELKTEDRQKILKIMQSLKDPIDKEILHYYLSNYTEEEIGARVYLPRGHIARRLNILINKVQEESHIKLRPYEAMREFQRNLQSQWIDFNLNESIQNFEIKWITKALEESKWNIDLAGKLLGIKRTTLFFKLKKLGIERPKV